MTIEIIEQFKNLSEHDRKEVLNLIKLKNEFKKQEIERKLKACDELIEYLKDLLENRYTNGKVVWFDSEYAKIYGELCTMAGANDDRLPLVPLSEIENILSKIEKSDK